MRSSHENLSIVALGMSQSNYNASYSSAHQTHSYQPELLKNLLFIWNYSQMGTVHWIRIQSMFHANPFIQKNIQSQINISLANRRIFFLLCQECWDEFRVTWGCWIQKCYWFS